MKETQVKQFWELYPTPKHDKEQSSRIYHGQIYNRDFSMEYTSMTYVGQRIQRDIYYNNRLKKMSER